jgi:hypothetical protein
MKGGQNEAMLRILQCRVEGRVMSLDRSRKSYSRLLTSIQ